MQRLAVSDVAEQPVAGSIADVTRLSLSDALALGSAVWDAVQARVESPSPFMSWAWHRAWADSAPVADVDQRETLVLRHSDGGVQGVLPLLRRRILFHRMPVTALTWAIGDLGCPDHLDVLATPGVDIGAVVPLLEDLGWQILVLSNLAPTATVARRLGEAMANRGHAVRLQNASVCPYLDLCDDWEHYLASVTSSRRQALRYMERNLRRHHAVAITDYDGDRLDEGWRHLVTLHERRWGGAGAFRDPRIDSLHRRFAAELARRGQLWLVTLDLDGEPAAAWYGFTWRDTVCFYQSGRDPRWERESVGQVLLAAMIRRGMERGFKRFDFLRGEDPYKRLWTAAQRTTQEITIFRRGLRGRWLRGVDAAAELRARFRNGKGAER
jgi:CelD/BcsL family acetyltransferase involved in cellulose biosynthesis